MTRDGMIEVCVRHYYEEPMSIIIQYLQWNPENYGKGRRL